MRRRGSPRARQASPLQTLRRALAGLGGVIAAAGLASAATLGNPLFGWTADDLGARVKGPLVLDGQKLTLHGVALDGETLSPNAYQIDGDHLTCDVPGLHKPQYGVGDGFRSNWLAEPPV